MGKTPIRPRSDIQQSGGEQRLSRLWPGDDPEARWGERVHGEHAGAWGALPSFTSQPTHIGPRDPPVDPDLGSCCPLEW